MLCYSLLHCSQILKISQQALSQVGALFGGPIGGFVADRFGRKCSMLFSGLPYLVGYMIISYAHYSPWAVVFQTLLLFGRFVSGFGMGWASAVVSVSSIILELFCNAYI